MPKLFASLAALVLVALPLVAQKPEPPKFGEQMEVNVVLADAIVTDRKGQQILGLDKDDFIVKENGVPQPVDSVDYFTNRRLLTGPEQTAAFKVERVREERYFILFFDKPNNGALFDQIALARSAAEQFISRDLKPGDLVAIAGHDVRLKVYSDFTSDKSRLQKALDEVARFGRGLKTSDAPPNGPSILRAVGASRMINRTGTVYEALEVLGDSVRGIRARKDVVLFSPGIREPGEESRRGILLSTSRYYDPMIHALNAANVTVYAVNLQQDPPNLPVVHQTLDRISSETNGEYFRWNTSFIPALEKVEKTTNGYYLITYTAHHPKGTQGYQKIEVALRNPEFRIRARDGYHFGE
ncbi:MAG TPA: VWA domain-containing protein [Thermoanaerobaculia bacterium]|nr:VWA domain-containing protein [Thermoanaerobaculia bacterium]